MEKSKSMRRSARKNPLFSIKKKNQAVSVGESRFKILNKKTPFAVVEAYKSTRTNLMFTRTDAGCQKIIVTSTLESEGKSINSLNLAITLAQTGLHVLLIDGDMRRPVVHKYLGIHDPKGLSEILAGLVKREQLFGTQGLVLPTAYENLFVLPAGHVPPNPAELLASPQMEWLLQEASKYYDYIILDTPPIYVVTDALVLAKHVNGYVIVVRAGSTPLEALQESVSRLEQVGANVLGFLLNDVDAHSRYGKYSHYGKYGHYSKYSHYDSGFSGS